MTAYQLNRVLYLMHVDPGFLRRFRDDAAAAMSDLPLAPDDAAALASGDIGTLYRKGAHPFLLHGFVRHGLCGLDQASYMDRVRATARRRALRASRPASSPS